MSAIGPTLEAFFIERLVGQRRASPHTIASYRDTFRPVSYTHLMPSVSTPPEPLTRENTPRAPPARHNHALGIR